MNFNLPIILASKSPRRQQLLASLGIPFEVKSVPVEEIYPESMPPLEVPQYLAQKKVAALAAGEKEALIIGADTVVLLNDQLLGKPRTLSQAAEFLRQLSGQKHQVVTGVCIQYQENISLFHDITEVQFADLSDDEIDYYVNKCQPLDKAGAYGIQEWIGLVAVTAIHGSYCNVVGLPVHRVYAEIKNLTV